MEMAVVAAGHLVIELEGGGRMLLSEPTHVTLVAQLLASITGRREGVYFSLKRGPIGDRIYAALSEDRAEIDKALGQSEIAKWTSSDKSHDVEIWKSFGPEILTTRRGEVQAWLSDLVNRFVDTFRPRIESLLREE